MPSPLMPWSPFFELDRLRSQLDRAYEHWGTGQERPWMPAIDVERNGNDLTIRADVPGVKPGDVNIEAQDGVLTISGKHEEATEKKDKDFLHRERRSGSFSRSIQLPEGVDASGIKAESKDGVIEITVPAPKESKKEPVKITPKAG